MPILNVSEEKVGPSKVVNVDMRLEDAPVFPAICPCCAELADDGAFIAATCEHLPSVSFPACAVCARHTAIEARVVRFVVPLLIALTLLTVAGFFLTRGADFVAEKGGGAGWQVLGALSNLRFPFTSPINAGVTLLGAFAVLLVYLFIYWLCMAPIMRMLSKSSCKWFNQAARTTRWYYSDAGGYCRRFIFENSRYAAVFTKANGPVANVSQSASKPPGA